MRIIASILRKEFIQIFRNRVMLPYIFIAPIVMMFVLVFAANLDMKEIKFYVVDKDLSAVSRKLTANFKGSSFFKFKGSGFDLMEAEKMIIKGDVDLVIHFHRGFEENLRRGGESGIQLLTNAINATKAGLIYTYSEGIIRDFNHDIRLEWLRRGSIDLMQNIDITHSFWYNPELNYKIFILPGILVILVTVIGMVLTALNLVMEKELGTAEQINVTPIKKYHFIIGKLMPFWVIALFDLAFGLSLGKIFFHLPILGNPLLLFGFASVYLLGILGMGLFLSTFADNQQQVGFLAFFFLLTFILMSGIFTPVESMPVWAQIVNVVNPIAYFMKIIRMILLKGSAFKDISHEFFAILVFAFSTLSLAVWRYRKIS